MHTTESRVELLVPLLCITATKQPSIAQPHSPHRLGLEDASPQVHVAVAVKDALQIVVLITEHGVPEGGKGRKVSKQVRLLTSGYARILPTLSSLMVLKSCNLDGRQQTAGSEQKATSRWQAASRRQQAEGSTPVGLRGVRATDGVEYEVVDVKAFARGSLKDLHAL